MGLTTVRQADKFQQALGHAALLCLSALLLLLHSAPLSATLRCGGGIVDEGDSAAQVRRHCGPPDHVEHWKGQPPAAPGVVWFYDRGASRLLRVLRFRAQRLVRIDSDGYGFGAAPQGRDCRPGDPMPGWSAYRLLVRCGAPEARIAVGHVTVPPRSDGTRLRPWPGQRIVYRERWQYAFGPRTHTREITLDNAIVTSIRTQERGA
ncbi:DUF2845 domain-containing protein [Algiphilus sp.]|uniref:DUF2845 domain-containing protein n=1 Tax=Algiphilus sp. TaxID=1872431 RepID=UPI002A65078C|nr:DUF2845 domain-containing protein [Pseudomonadota bacterium]